MYDDSLGAGRRHGIDQVIDVKGCDSSDADIAPCGEVVALGRIDALQFGIMGLNDFADIIRPLILGEDDSGRQCRTSAENKPAFEVRTLVELAPPRS